MSRSLFPKQFAALAGESSLFEQTLERLAGLGLGAPIVVGNEEHRFIVAEQLRGAGTERHVILLEPEGCNTAAAIALAARVAIADDPEAVLFAVPSDHWIGNADELERGVRVAAEAAARGRIVAFGIRPTSPHTGYGYIRGGAALANVPGAHVIDAFREKRDAATLEKCLGEGGWLWNSGMFLSRARDALEQIAACAPEVGLGAAAAMAAAGRDGDFLRPDKESFLALPSLPFDIAVMEKTARGAVVPVDLNWTDLGDWNAIQNVLPVDGMGNTLVGDVMAFDTRNAVVRSDGPLVAAVGLDGIVVVATDDAVLVTSRDVHETESVYVPVGTPHRVANPGKIPLRLIEVQTGGYLSEEDIVRFEDSYGRT